ncbi:MAG: PorV/PorQ family protein [bacterium]
MRAIERFARGVAVAAVVVTAFAAALAPARAWAQSKAGTAIGQFMLIEPSARVSAMGNAGVAIFDGIQSVYYNPAALGQVNQWSAQFTHSAWIAGIAYDYAALAIPVRNVGTFFASFTALNSGDISVRTVEQPLGTGERFDVSNLALAAGYGRQFTERFAAGAQINYIEETIWHSSLRTVTFNVGTVYRLSAHGLQIGSSISNYGTKAGYNGRDLRVQFDNDPTRYGDNSSLPAEQFTDDFLVPVLFRVGVSLPRDIGENSRLLLAVDALHPADNTESMSLGAEWVWKTTLGLRAGYQDIAQEDSEVGLTMGAGVQGDLDTYTFNIDYAWADHGRLDDTHRMTFAVMF